MVNIPFVCLFHVFILIALFLVAPIFIIFFFETVIPILIFFIIVRHRLSYEGTIGLYDRRIGKAGHLESEKENGGQSLLNFTADVHCIAAASSRPTVTVQYLIVRLDY